MPKPLSRGRVSSGQVFPGCLLTIGFCVGAPHLHCIMSGVGAWAKPHIFNEARCGFALMGQQLEVRTRRAFQDETTSMEAGFLRARLPASASTELACANLPVGTPASKV